MTENVELPVVIIGAGPVGLAAAAHVLERGLPPLIFEAGASAGASVSQWGHVRLFSPWRYNIDAAARRLLEDAGWTAPRLTSLPYGHDMVDQYLQPLAAVPTIAEALHTDSRVLAITRDGLDKTHSKDRSDRPFLVRVQSLDGTVTDHRARAVIDASGTWSLPAPLGAAGLAAASEDSLRRTQVISPPLPDVGGRDRVRFAGKHVLVVGSGHSAANTLLSLAEVQRDAPQTRISWVVRSASVERLYGGGSADQLPARGRLGTQLRSLVEDGTVELTTSFGITGFRTAAGAETGVSVHGTTPAGPRALNADVVIGATGFRPDLSILAELRLELDPAVEAPRDLGPLIDPELHSCGTVPAHGAAELAHPEKDFYIVGMKSYGRAPTFLLATGYEQVRSVAAALAGDLEAAARVELDLPETGVCTTAVPTAANADAADPSATHADSADTFSAAGGCCAPAAAPVVAT